jgi:hypothetical protein
LNKSGEFPAIPLTKKKTRIMVKFYNYNNQQIPAKITLLALQKWEKAQELKEGDDYLILFKLALESGHKIENKKLELSDNDVEILFEMYGLVFLDDMTDFFFSSSN